MPLAELHGKLSRSGSNLSERLEDQLTSDVFGRLRYLHPDRGLLPIVMAAESMSGAGCPVATSIHGEPEWVFWPTFPGVEPDVLITFDTPEGQTAVIVECKYLSGKSGSFNPGDENIVASASADQLAREFLALETLRQHFPRRFLLYVTGHEVVPSDEIDASFQALAVLAASSNARSQVFWLSWSSIWRALTNECRRPFLTRFERLVVDDLLALLRHKGYRSFTGWPEPERPLCSADGSLWYSAGPSWSWLTVMLPAVSRPLWYDEDRE
jgi:hypothetical protein